jgi:signal transduction histidine kinase
LATVDAGIMELDISDMTIAKTVRAAADAVAERFAENKVRLEINLDAAPEKMRGDENRIRQILSNLLVNAANFAPVGSAVALTCRHDETGTTFSVHDDGPGMPPEMVENAFGAFESKANGGRRRGAGLGLAIVKSFVQLHGGSVSIDTGSGQGTTVTVVFPIKPLSGGQRDAAE